jgi:predicted RNA-binding Zn-ribbon protein involved in translation (DUF1610 family)
MMVKKKSPTTKAKVHPTQDRREIDRHFKWEWGHDPNDPDTHPDSGWNYFKVEHYTPTEPDQRNLLTGGPDTGYTCQRCGNNTYRIAAERTLDWVLSQPEVEIVGEKPDMEKLKQRAIVIWACPSCSHRVQWRKDMMPQLKEK